MFSNTSRYMPIPMASIKRCNTVMTATTAIKIVNSSFCLGQLDRYVRVLAGEQVRQVYGL